MFKKKTVFILGAGASWHYGYPTGEELVRMVRTKAEYIVQQYLKPNDKRMVPIDWGSTHPRNFKEPDFRPFLNTSELIQRKIEQANPLVIDDFLGRNDDVADVGKLLIAAVLFDCQKIPVIRSGKIDENTGNDTGKGDWIRYIVQQLTVDCKTPSELLNNEVTFVTFNYDLSLEVRLHKALKNYHWFAKDGFSDRFFTTDRFLHVYGQLYGFDPAHPGAPKNFYNNTEFPLANEIDRAHDAAQNIRTISPYEKAAAPEIVKVIAEAEYLYFLGYGFDHRNNKLLGLGQRLDGPHVQYVKFTNFGNHNKVSKAVSGRFHINPDALTSEHYIDQGTNDQGASSGGRVYFPCEKSVKTVYDALAQDFDWPE
jgi:hypothetical protein